MPFSLLALGSGVLQSLGTSWGLVRYYWVLAKLVLTFAATALLILHQFTAVSRVARAALASADGEIPDVGRVGAQLTADAAGAVVVLVIATVLAIYKPWGRTYFAETRNAAAMPGVRLNRGRGAVWLAVAFVVLIMGLVLLHHRGGGGWHRH